MHKIIIIACDIGRYPLGVLTGGIKDGDPLTVLSGADCKGTERNITECVDVFTSTCPRSAGVICPVRHNG